VIAKRASESTIKGVANGLRRPVANIERNATGTRSPSGSIISRETISTNKYNTIILLY
jgi:hypothetical protein